MKPEQLFLENYDKISEKLLRHIFFRVNNQEVAEDILQETFLKTWRYLAENQGEINNLRAFTYRIAENMIIDHYRQKPRTPLALEDFEHDPSVTSSPEAEIGIKISSEKTLDALNSLSAEAKKIMLYKFVDQLSSKEIRELTGKTISNINVIIHRSIKELKNKLDV